MDLDLNDEFDSLFEMRQISGLNLATFQGNSINFDGVSMKLDECSISFFSNSLWAQQMVTT